MFRHFYRIIITVVLLLAITAGALFPATTEAAVDDWQQGASIVPRTKTDLASAAAKSSMDQLAASGANYVTFVIPYYQSTVTSHDLHRGPDTPTDATLKTAIAYARSKGLKIMLKPHLEPETGQWRAHIKAANRTAWYTAYGNMLVHYGKLAQAGGAMRFCLGSELVSMSSSRVNSNNTARWQAMIKRVRAVYDGRLTYSAQRPGSMGELETIRFWPQLDYIGVSGYFPLQITGTPTVAKLKTAWAHWERNDIRPVQKRYNRPVLFTEIGYRSITGSYAYPWDWRRTGTPNQAHQAMAYEAFFSFWNSHSYMRGVHLWEWEPRPTAGGPGSTSYTAQNKTAYKTLMRWWKGTGTYTPAPIVETIAVWWPNQDAVLSGVVPFQAIVSSRPIQEYKMYWRVDGGTSVLMNNTADPYPHKRAYVDVSAWNWNPTNNYVVDLIAFDNAGKQIAQTSIRITVVH